MVMVLKRPSIPIFSAEEFVGLIAVGKTHLRSIPNKLFHRQFLAHFGTERDVAEENYFGEGAGPIEVGTGRFAAFAGFDPFSVMADGARNFFWWIAVFFGPLLRNELEPAAALAAQAENFAFVADEEMTVGAHFLVLFKFWWARWAQIAVVPDESEWRHFTTRRKFVCDHGRERVSLGVNASGAGLDAERIVPLTPYPLPVGWGEGVKNAPLSRYLLPI